MRRSKTSGRNNIFIGTEMRAEATGSRTKGITSPLMSEQRVEREGGGGRRRRKGDRALCQLLLLLLLLLLADPAKDSSSLGPGSYLGHYSRGVGSFAMPPAQFFLRVRRYMDKVLCKGAPSSLARFILDVS
jgi:hypothetical protein